MHTHYQRARGLRWLLDQDSRSWASVHLNPTGPPYLVRQGGPRRLFDEIAAAYRWWRALGEPWVADWLVSVGPAGQRAELRR